MNAPGVRTSKTIPKVKGPEPRELLEAPLRRPLLVVIPFVAVFTAAVVSLFVLPKKYQSSTLILVESDRVPVRFVQQAATESFRERISTVKQEILSRTRLEKVVRETNPYPDLLPVHISAAVEQLRASIEISVRGNDAFSIEFVHREPQKAMAVANRLASLFIEETVRDRERQVQEAYGFIESQLVEARAALTRREEELRVYKERHLGTLPEQLPANLSTLQRLQQEQQAGAEQLSAAEERRRQMLDAMRKGGGPVADVREAEYAQLRQQLETLRLRYTDEHPDVRVLLARISRLEQAIAGGSTRGRDPVPAMSLESQITVVDAEIAALRNKQRSIESRIDGFESRVEQAPRTEQDLATLTRDYENLKQNYLALLDKKLDAQMTARLEERWRGESFKVLDPAHLPERPISPKPPLFLAVGLLGGLAAGLGLAVVAETLDQSIKSVEELESLGPYPVLATIPHVDSPKVRRGTLS